MTRERLAWLVSVMLLSILAFQIPGTLAQRDDDYAWVRTLTEVHQQVYDNYVDPVNDEDLKEHAIEGMLSDLDPYTTYIPPTKQEDFDKALEGSFKGVGLDLELRNGEVTIATPIEGSPADRAGIHADDVIVKVNGKPISGWPIERVSKEITGPVGTPVRLTVRRDGKEMDFTMDRQQIVLETVKGYDRDKHDAWNYYCMTDPKIAYIRITQFDNNTFETLKSVFEGQPPSPGDPGHPGLLDTGMKGLILDLRFNPGGRLDQAIQVVNLFVKQGVIVRTKGRNRPEDIQQATGEGTLPDFPMIVLVNDKSASAAEIVSGSLKDNHRATIIGQRTFGKGSVQEIIPLDEQSGKLKLTVAYYYLPSGRLVHRRKGATDWGVQPDIAVPTDDQQQYAIEELMLDHETIRRPDHPTTQPESKPTTQPVDPQLLKAKQTMAGMVAMGGSAPTTREVR